MTDSRLRLVKGDDSPENRFKAYVREHSYETDSMSDVRRIGTYALDDVTQLVPVTELVFKVREYETGHTHSINLHRTNGGVAVVVYGVWYDDDPDEPGFYDEASNPISDYEAMRLVGVLTAAEEFGQLTKQV